MSRTAPTRVTDGPTLERERIDSLDILRGFALLGILLINIKSFSMPEIVFPYPNTFGDFEGANKVVWILVHVLVELKFMTMFCMMFGAGILLMSEHRDAAGAPVLRVHYRRMILMLIFGLIHAYLIWYGDILVSYAICGCAAVWFRKLGPWTLTFLGAILITAGCTVFALRINEVITEVPEAYMDWPIRYPQRMFNEEIEAYLGTWGDNFPWRAETAWGMQTWSLPRITFWRLTGLMCIGMALYKWRILQAARSRTFYIVMAIVCGGIGMPAMILSARNSLEHNFSFHYEFSYGAMIVYWASIPSAFMWIALIMLLSKTPALRFAQYILGCYGRMAFTNYIGQSLIATWIFYGYGLGLFGSVSRVEQIGIVAIIWAVQLTYSPIWLRYFQFGPLEWVWRTGVYGRFQPILRRPDPDPLPLPEEPPAVIEWDRVVALYFPDDAD